MKSLFGVMILSLLVFASAARAAGPDEQYLQIFNMVQEGDGLNAGGQTAAALAKYEAANAALKQFQTTYPTWNPRVVYYRLDYLASKITDISARTPPPPAAPAQAPVVIPQTPAIPSVALPFAKPPDEPAPTAAPNPAEPMAGSVQTANQLQAMQDHIRQLEADKGLLEAKLREALAARPAAVDPRELAKAQEQIRELQKQNEVLKVTLDEAKAAGTTNAPAAAESAKALADVNKKLALLTEANAALVAEKQALQARVNTQASPDAALAALREENQVLKKQLAGMSAPGAKETSAGDLNRKLLEAQAQVAVLQSDKEMLRLETIALQDRVKKLTAAAPAQPAVLPFPTGLAVDAMSAEKIRQLEAQRDELQKNLTAARAELAGRKPAGETATRVDELTRELQTLHARIDVLEARRLPYTDEELAMLSKPEPTMLAAAVRSSSASPVKKPVQDLPVEAVAMLNEARQDVMAGQMDKAEQKYLEILKLNDQNVSTLADLASIQVELNHLTDAEKNIKTALALDPDNEYSLFVLGRLRFQQEKYDEALEAFSRAAELNPKSAETQNYLGITLSEKGLRGPAEAALRKAIQLDPHNADAHANLAFIYITQTPPLVELAKWHYEKALAAGHSRNASLEKLLNTKPPPGP